MNITNFFYSIAAYNTRAYQVSDIQNEYSDHEYITSRVFTCLGAMLLCVVFVISSGYPPEQVIIIICYMGFRTADAFIDVLHGIAHKHRRLDYAGISMITRGLLILISFSILGRQFGLLQAIIGMTALTAAFGLLYDIKIARMYIVPASFSYTRVWGLLKKCFPLMLTVLFFTFFASYTRYLLEQVQGTAALGAYASATTPAIALQLAVSFLFAPLTNLFAEYIKKSDFVKLNKLFVQICLLITGATLVCVLLSYAAGQKGLLLLFGDDILPYAYLLPGGFIVAGLTASLWFLNMVFSTIRDIKGIFFSCLAGAAVCIITAEMFIAESGLAGANYAMFACQGAVVSVLLVRYMWLHKKRGAYGKKEE